MFRSDTMSPWWKTNLRRSSQRFEPPYVHSTFVFSFNPIHHFSSSPSCLYIDLATALFFPNVAGSFATVRLFLRMSHTKEKRTTEAFDICGATPLSRDDDENGNASSRNEKSEKYSGIYRNFYASKLTLRSLLLPFLLANERRASGR